MKRKTIIVILIIGCILFISGCGKKEEEKVKQKEAEPEDIRDLREVEINNLLERIDDLYYFDINPAKSFKTSELTNQEVLLWAADVIGNLNGASYSDLEELAKDYLDFSLEPENILCMTHSNILGSSDYTYLYDVETKKYVKNDHHASHQIGGFYSDVANRYAESRYENGNYIISVYKIFSETNYYPGASAQVKREYYNSYSEAKSKSNNIVAHRLKPEEAEEKIKEIDVSKLKKYTYIFGLKDGNFVLKSYEIGE